MKRLMNIYHGFPRFHPTPLELPSPAALSSKTIRHTNTLQLPKIYARSATNTYIINNEQ